MAIRHLVNTAHRSRRSSHALTSLRSQSTTVDSGDSSFLQHNSPHPTLTISHTDEILSAPLTTQITTLPNGLRVATESNFSLRTATVGVYIDSGSRYEAEETDGTAYFLKHMIRSEANRLFRMELEEDIENIGGRLKAFNSREQTFYHAKVMDKSVPQALNILSDILQNSNFPKKRINRVRNFILRRMEEVECDKYEFIFDHLHATAFPYTSLGRDIFGPAENIKTIGEEHLRNYTSTHYTAPRMVIAASGSVKHEDIVEQVKKLFTKLSADPTTASELVSRQPAIFTGSEIRMPVHDLLFAEFAVAFEGASWTDPDSIALMVMQSMLGSWDRIEDYGKHMMSDLAHRVGFNFLADRMMAFNINYKDTGLFGVYAVAEPDCLDELANAIMYEISKLCYQVTEVDVILARSQLKSSLMHDADETIPVAGDIGPQLLTYGRRIPLTELFARIDSLNANTIKRVANRFICDKDIVIAAMGPIQGLPDYNWFRRRTYW